MTVYQYAKQKKIIKIPDPHRLFREARYKMEEVEELAEERKRNLPTGLRPSELAKRLRIPVSKVYAVIKELELPVDEIKLGDEAKGYSISSEFADIISIEILRSTPARGVRAEFFESKHDIALYQRFVTPNNQSVRVLRNEQQDWGFFLQSRTWISYEDAIQVHKYRQAYDLHQVSKRAKGYTDFTLFKDLDVSFDFLDFIYQVWGIENIRLRERDTTIELSVKSGTMELTAAIPDTITPSLIASFLDSGEVIQEDEKWCLVSGYRSTTFDLPTTLLDEIQKISKQKDISMSRFVQMAVQEKLKMPNLK